MNGKNDLHQNFEIKLKTKVTIIENPVEIKIITKKWTFVLDKIDKKWCAVRNAFLKDKNG